MSEFGFSTSHANGAARLGEFRTPHGAVQTPAFMPVGTHASVRGLAMHEIRDAGAQMVLANAYHLYLRPGDEMVRALGGVHAFARWNGPMLTDSGGYQVFSLSRYRTVTEDGVEFRSKLDGSRHRYTPEKVMQIERNIGADVIMQLDELIEGGSSFDASRAAMERSLRWLERCRVEFDRLSREGRAPIGALRVPDGAPALATTDVERDRVAPPQALFPIVQGGTYADLRRASIEGILGTGDWVGVAVGGLSVGEAKEAMYDTFDVCSPLLPADKPRYLMGVGFPDDLLEAVARGMDLFDCVAPTRMGRHGTVFTRDGKTQVQKSSNRTDRRALTDSCPCPACTQYDRAYLRHLMVTEEPLGPRLLALHNLTFLMELMRETRGALRDGVFASWSAEWLARYRRKGRD
ncbi:MAG TPA: tRNA guanosine(34) transglycosylase Tgt [Gemmatimonas sp.]|uniref:tRNA guanosine(34) transglycosylase Tgt n=1 Tax=Gemmatimonas sp. TaxID=1962908 RepID=UPI002ED9E6D3